MSYLRFIPPRNRTQLHRDLSSGRAIELPPHRQQRCSIGSAGWDYDGFAQPSKHSRRRTAFMQRQSEPISVSIQRQRQRRQKHAACVDAANVIHCTTARWRPVNPLWTVDVTVCTLYSLLSSRLSLALTTADPKLENDVECLTALLWLHMLLHFCSTSSLTLFSHLFCCRPRVLLQLAV